jgi:hypothetical protein
MFQLIDEIYKYVQVSDWAVVFLIQLEPSSLISTPKMQDMEKHVWDSDRFFVLVAQLLQVLLGKHIGAENRHQMLFAHYW